MNDETEALPPVTISGMATKALSDKMRQWTGWPKGRLVFGTPPHNSPHAITLNDEQITYVNADALILNPHRVLLTATPFRLRQEAVLTGVMLHEAGHARHSHWLNTDGTPPVHSDGTEVTEQTVGLARLMEEPRIEGLMAGEASKIGADGLAWTMRASAAHLMPMTELSADPDQQIMDLISSWALRAGRQIALSHNIVYNTPRWVLGFTSLLQQALTTHLTTPEWEENPFGDGLEEEEAPVDPAFQAGVVMNMLRNMITCTDDTGPTMLDVARDILAILFPETEGGDEEDGEGGGVPMVSLSCGAGQPDSESESGEGGQGDEAGEQGEGNTEPEDEGSGDDPGAGDSGSQAQSDEEQAQSEEQAQALAQLMAALAEIEKNADKQTEGETATQMDTPAPVDDGEGGRGAGTGGSIKGLAWRNPSKEERGTQRGAEHFLRTLIDPTEATVTSLTDAPAATVDGAALSAWKAGGEIRAPHFFRRSRRESVPAPPVQVAVLVDVSISMSVLAKPSALLSWALACAALDLRNFAGRGQQVNSCLIHWGSSARVIQSDGQTMPGILDWHCGEGTSALDAAHDLVEEQMPGFFSVRDRPVNRLLVQFTDWELGGNKARVQQQVNQAMRAGVNMISVVPPSYHMHSSFLENTIAHPRFGDQSGWVGKSAVMRYNPMFPEEVWTHAAEMLRVSGNR